MLQISLKTLRENAGLSQAKLAKLLGVSQSTVGMWESGKNKPEFANLEKLSKIFNVSPDYLIGIKAPDLSAIDLRPIGDIIRMRVTASISAGYNGLAEVFEDEYAEIPVSLLKGYAPKDIKILRVKGDSMYPRICAGDLVVMHVQESVDPGDIPSTAPIKKSLFIWKTQIDRDFFMPMQTHADASKYM